MSWWTVGVLLSIASTPAFAQTDGKELFRTISSELARYEAANDVSELMAEVRKSIESAEIRSIEFHEYTITRYPDLFYDVSGLTKGQHPYHTTGDWDCDGDGDQAVILDAPKSQVVVVLGNGKTLVYQTSVDGISPGTPGRHLTAAGKGAGDGEGKASIAAKCGFISADNWGKSSVALVVDPDGEKLLRYRMSD